MDFRKNLAAEPTSNLQSYVVLGTDTNVGKTVVAAMLCLNLPAVYWKPIQSGLDPNLPTDSEFVETIISGSDAFAYPEAFRLPMPASPHLAAKMAKQYIDEKQLGLDVQKIQESIQERSKDKQQKIPKTFIIEGAGGVMVPLNERILLLDLVAQWQLPVILVARTAVGTINHSLLSIQALNHKRIPIHGLIFVGTDSSERESMKTIFQYTKVRILGHLPKLREINAASLKSAFAANFHREDF